ncbi:MAG: hypothetical protein QM734_05825 [Cyclobacteriaceae bacterium]
MEYSFKKSAKDKRVIITLNEFDLVVTTDEKTSKIPYPQITEVRLCRMKSTYIIKVDSMDCGTLAIPNHTIDANGKIIDQSRAYQTFVRVLHMHLRDKSKAVFYTGLGVIFQSIYVIAALLGAGAIFVIEEYFDVTPMSGIILSAIMFVGVVVILILSNFSQWQRTYSPTEVPLNMLPPA